MWKPPLKAHGTSSAYLAARIKREAPEIAARIHEFDSMAAAARAAGIKVPKPKRITLGDPAAHAAAIRAMGDDYARAVMDAIAAEMDRRAHNGLNPVDAD